MAKTSIPPCYKYIAKVIRTEDERHLYTHNYFENMERHKVSREESNMLFLLNKLPDECGEQFSIGGISFSLDEYLNEVADIAGVESIPCNKYYKSVIHPDAKNNLCLLCPFSKSYALNEYQDECKIFKYMTASRANYDKTSDVVVPGIFRSVYDIADGIKSDIPAVVPLLHIALEVLHNDYGIFFNESDHKKRLSNLIGKITMIASQNKNVQQVQAVNFKALIVAWEKFVDDILSSPDVDDKEVNALISRLDLAYCHKQKKAKKNKNETNINAPSLFDIVKDVPNSQSIAEAVSSGDVAMSTEQGNANDNAGQIDEQPAEQKDHSGPEQIPEQADHVDASDEPLGVHDIDYTDDDIEYGDDGFPIMKNAENGSTDTEDDSYSDADIGSLDTVSPEDETEHGTETVAENPPEPPSTQVPNVRKYSIPKSRDESFIYRIKVTDALVEEFSAPYMQFESDVFKSVMQSQILPVEVVYTDSNTAYLFMYVRPLRSFFHIVIGSDMPNTLIACMNSSKVRKVCYQPYFLYSLMRLYDVHLKNVYSLASADRIVHPTTMMCVYSDFFKVFANSFEAEPFDTSSKELDELMYAMQGYILIQAMFDRTLRGKSAFNYQKSVDEVLGTSFLRIINLTTNDLLFDLDANGVVMYNTNVDFTARHTGYFVSYSIGMDDAPGISRDELYMGALVDLSSKGRFYKYNIQLVTIASESMVLFIGEDEYELIITLLQKYFNRYAITHGLEKFELNAAHQKVYGKDKPNIRKKLVLPSTVDEALDLLVTVNDSVTVSSDHVVTRTKASKNKRKKQTKKFEPK